jgi:hypothetical protein
VSNNGDPRDHRPEAWLAASFPPCPSPKRGWEPVYLRYSEPPPGGLSRNFETGDHEAGTSVFKAFKTPDDAILVDLQESLPLALTYTRVSAGYRRPYLMTGEVVGYSSFGREPLLKVVGFESVPRGTKIGLTCGPLPPWFTSKVLLILEQQRRAVAAARRTRRW